MLIVMITSAAKADRLGDVVFGLGREVEIFGNAVEIVRPKYAGMRYGDIWGLQPSHHDLPVPWYGGPVQCTVWFGFARGRMCFSSSRTWRMTSSMLAQALADHNAAAGSAARIERLVVMARSADPDGGEITDRRYVNQRQVLIDRSTLVELFYAQPTPADVIVAGTAGRTA